MPSAGFEPTIPAIERVQTYILGLMATGIGDMNLALFPVCAADGIVDVPAEIRRQHRPNTVTAVRHQSDFGTIHCLWSGVSACLQNQTEDWCVWNVMAEVITNSFV